MIKNVGLWRIKIFLILTTMTFFIACQKDDESSLLQLKINQNLNSQIQTVTENVSANEIPEIMDYLSTKGNSRGQFSIIKQSDDTTRLNEPDLVIGELQTREILKVTDQNNKSNYTFSLTSIESNDPTTKSFFNLVIKETSRGLLPFIIEYRPDINWIPNYRNPEDFSQFTGDILYYSIDGIFSSKVTMILGVFTSMNQRTPCEDDNSDNTAGGDESPDGNNDGDSTDGDSNSDNSDGDSSDGDSSGEGDWVLVCEQVILVIDSNACGGDPCGISFEHCEIQPENSPIPPSEGLFRNPCLPDTEDICYQDNTEPCPNGCNADTTGCAEETDNDESDSNPTVGVVMELSVPCFKIDNALDDDDVADFITDLDGAHTEPNERGYGVSKNPDTGNFTTESVLGGRRSTPLPVGGDIVGAGHIHTSDGYPMFSGDDVANLLLLYFRNENRNHPTNPTRPDDIFSYLETSLGSYFISIDDTGALSALSGTNNRHKEIRNKLNRAYRKSDPNSQSDFVKAFFKTIKIILEDENVSTNPIRMFRLNSDNSTLVEMVLNENEEVEEKEPCND